MIRKIISDRQRQIEGQPVQLAARIIWSDRKRFELENWRIPEQGFKWDAERSVWFTSRATTVDRLRGRPNLTITKDAFEHVKNGLAKKKPRAPRVTWSPKEPVDTQKFLAEFKPYQPPPPPTILCTVCGTPVWFFEKQDN